jgi:hypothetical protein
MHNETAISVLRNDHHASLHGARHFPHVYRDAIGNPEARDYLVNEEQVSDWTSRIQRATEEFSRLLPESTLNVSYEDLCGDRDARALPREESAKITTFLGVSDGEELVTTLRKTSSPQ